MMTVNPTVATRRMGHMTGPPLANNSIGVLFSSTTKARLWVIMVGKELGYGLRFWFEASGNKSLGFLIVVKFQGGGLCRNRAARPYVKLRQMKAGFGVTKDLN